MCTYIIIKYYFYKLCFQFAFALASISSSTCSVQTRDVNLNKMLTAVHLTLHVIMRSDVSVECRSSSAEQSDSHPAVDCVTKPSFPPSQKWP